MNKLLVAVLGPWMFTVPNTDETIENHRPSLVTQNPFVVKRVQDGQIKVLANQIDPKYTDEDVEKAWDKYVKSIKEGETPDQAKFAKEFADKHSAKEAAAGQLPVTGEEPKPELSDEEKQKKAEDEAKAGRIAELKGKLEAANIPFLDGDSEETLQNHLKGSEEILKLRATLTEKKIAFDNADTAEQLRAKVPKQ